VRPCLDDVVTDDDTPVDNMFSEKQQRLLTEPLYSSWQLPCSPEWLPVLELGRTLWSGPFENWDTNCLRWCDRQGRVVPTGAERAERLAARLRAMGVTSVDR
jgi:hypothetical protein